MKNKTLMKIISICFIVVMIFNYTSSTIYAAINEEYGSQSEVVETDLEAKLKSSSLLDAIATLVYGLGSLVENLVGAAFQMLTGTNMFPWADRVIFNTVPFLDVNFLNPSNSSLFRTSGGSDSALASIVKNTYYTVLVLAIGFLGIVVGVMAIRLAVSSIAAEKARYKEAIVKFIFSLVMLFCVHYLIAFVFYINESMVEIASSILSENLSGVTIASDFFSTALDDKTLINNFFETQEILLTSYNAKKDQILNDEESVKIAASLLKNSDYKSTALKGALGNDEEEHKIINGIMNYATQLFGLPNGSSDAVDNFMADINTVKTMDETKAKQMEESIKKYNSDPNASWEEFKKTPIIGTLVGSSDTIEKAYKSTLKDLTKRSGALVTAYKAVNKSASSSGSSSGSGSGTDLIAQMGQYFKESAWTYETDDEGNIEGWSASELSLQGALLYAIFVVQSMLFFVAYIKRFFFVVILALLAPVIVIYDFLGSATM